MFHWRISRNTHDTRVTSSFPMPPASQASPRQRWGHSFFLCVVCILGGRKVGLFERKRSSFQRPCLALTLHSPWADESISSVTVVLPSSVHPPVSPVSFPTYSFLWKTSPSGPVRNPPPLPSLLKHLISNGRNCSLLPPEAGNSFLILV